ncbi:DUF2897 family protein [Halopseudomonas bauzanensis]|nr:DUF2897 family protein [Halopseudomonas bauzanensis]
MLLYLPYVDPLTILRADLQIKGLDMSGIGWLFIIIILATVIGGLYMLRKTANKMPIGDEQMKRIKARQAELEAQERREKQQD